MEGFGSSRLLLFSGYLYLLSRAFKQDTISYTAVSFCNTHLFKWFFFLQYYNFMSFEKFFFSPQPHYMNQTEPDQTHDLDKQLGKLEELYGTILILIL